MTFKYLKFAQKLALRSDHKQHRLACLIVKKDRLISFGYNQLKTHTHSPHSYKSTHAEFHAVWGENPKDLKGSTAYIYREHLNGEFALARSCPSCYNMLKSVGIKNIIYTVENGIKEESL